MTRRKFLILVGAGGLTLIGLRFGIPRLLRPNPPRPLSGAVLEFVERCFAGLDRSRVWDCHVHVVGLGSGESGCWINPEVQSHLHPIKRLQYDVYRNALGMSNPETADADYIELLLTLQQLANPAGKLVLLAFDYRVNERGEEVSRSSAFYIPNDYVLRVVREHPAEFRACVSIHPYRRDAVERLDDAAEQGACAVK